MLCRPAAVHCQASERYPGSAAQTRERSCQPLPQLASQAPQGPFTTAAAGEASVPTLATCVISACMHEAISVSYRVRILMRRSLMTFNLLVFV